MTEIQKLFPSFSFAPTFVENDDFWDPDHRETDAAVRLRMRKFLDNLFDSDSNTFISITSHSGALRELLATINHRPFRLETGTPMPVLVKGRRLIATSVNRTHDPQESRPIEKGGIDVVVPSTV